MVVYIVRYKEENDNDISQSEVIDVFEFEDDASILCSENKGYWYDEYLVK